MIIAKEEEKNKRRVHPAMRDEKLKNS